MYILIFLFSFTIYLFTLCPTIYGYDSPEITTTTYLLSIPHPPGYPLYLLIIKLFYYLPINNIAFKANLSSAFFASLVVIIIYFIILKLLDNNFIATLSSLTFASAATFWHNATYAEVYTFNISLFCVIFLTLLNFYKTKNMKFLYLFSFIFGLTFANTFLILTFLPALLFLFLSKNFKIDKFVNLLILFFLGVIVYSFLVIRTFFHYEFARFELSNISWLLNFIKAEGYQEVSIDILRYKATLPIIVGDIILQFTIIGLFLIIYGIYDGIKKDKNLTITLILLIILNAIFSLPALFSFDIKAFFLPTYFSFIILLSIGANELQKKYKKLIVILLIMNFLFLTIANYHKCNKNDYYFLYNLANKILDSVERNSIIIAPNSSTYFSFALIYLQNVEKKMHNVILIYPMYLREERYKEYLMKTYPELEIPPSTRYLPSDFFQIYYEKHPVMKLLNTITNNAVTKGIKNHYNCVYLTESIINRNYEKFNIYLINNEIYETPNVNLKEKYYLLPANNFLFKLTQNYEEIKFDEPKLEYKDELTKSIYKNYYLELTKAYYYLGNQNIAHHFYEKAKKLDKRVIVFNEFINKNYRGISDRVMKEYLIELKNNEQEKY